MAAKTTEMEAAQQQTFVHIIKAIRTGIRDLGISEHDMRKACESAINSSRG